jgi:hypothetical protein
MSKISLLTFLFSFNLFAQSLCDYVETVGNRASVLIEYEFSQKINGEEVVINNAQKVILDNVTHVNFRKCEMQFRMNLDLLRSVLPDTFGHALISATAYRFNGSEVCFRNIHVKDILLNDSSRIEERFYLRIANKAIKNKECFRL